MKIYEYKNYSDYVEAQTEANKRKIKLVWSDQKVINKSKIYKPVADNILCHGVRNGSELEMFRNLYNSANIIGTEISETASKFPNVIQHDFQDVKKEWIGKFDIVYSNSFDHAIRPESTITAWSNQLKNNGVIIVELMIGNENRSKRSDPLEISQKEFIELVDKANLSVIDITSAKQDMSSLFVLEKNHVLT